MRCSKPEEQAKSAAPPEGTVAQVPRWTPCNSGKSSPQLEVAVWAGTDG